MPLVKVIRNGQITLPKEPRRALEIQEGDLLEVKLSESGMTIKPKVPVDKDLARDQFWSMLKEIRQSVKNIDPQELSSPAKWNWTLRYCCPCDGIRHKPRSWLSQRVT